MAAKGRTLALVAVLLLLYVASSYGAVTASMAARGAPLTGPCTEAKKKHGQHSRATLYCFRQQLFLSVDSRGVCLVQRCH